MLRISVADPKLEMRYLVMNNSLQHRMFGLRSLERGAWLCQQLGLAFAAKLDTQVVIN